MTPERRAELMGLDSIFKKFLDEEVALGEDSALSGKETVVTLRLSQEESKQLRLIAESCGLTLAQLARYRLLSVIDEQAEIDAHSIQRTAEWWATHYWLALHKADPVMFSTGDL